MSSQSNSLFQTQTIFDSLSYGPAPEADTIVQEWLNKHERKFGHFIDGKWDKPEGRETVNSTNPSTDEILATTIQGVQDDVEAVVKAAKKAFTSWSTLSPHTRARYLYSIARNIQKHQKLLAVLESMDNGKPIRETRDYDIPTVINHVYHHAGWAQLMDTEMRGWKPLGVVVGIVPWNFPLMILMWKVCPALAMGNTVILKPASYTRLSCLLLAEIFAQAGLPAGVFNVVTGNGAFGSSLADHIDVNKVAFTGSTGVGQKLRQLTAGSGKKLSLELGGKSPVIVFENADLDSAVEGVVDAIWFNQGQVCCAGSKLLVQEPIYEEMISRLKKRLDCFRIGSGQDKAIDMGAIVNESQRKSIDSYVEEARNEGAKVYQPSLTMPNKGCFYLPTLITDVQTVSRVVEEEIFGPVLVAMSFRTAKEAIKLANNTIYGLGASVWTETSALGLEVASAIQAGAVWINCHNVFDAAAGFGGFKQSGYGRDGGKEGLYEYVQPSWMNKPKHEKVEVDMKAFGSAEFSHSLPGNQSVIPPNTDLTTAPSVDRTYKLYYRGGQKRPDGQASRTIFNNSGKMVGVVPESNRKDVRNAVEAAQKAAPGWANKTSRLRSQIMYYIAENLGARCDENAKLLHEMTGREMNDCLNEVQLSIERLFHWAAYCDKYGGTVQETTLYGLTVKIHQAVGVVGIACPDENPLLSFVSLFAPAFARGNVTVIVPSEKHPLSAMNMYQIFDTSDVPAGVINLLSGNRDHISKYLTEHHNVQAMWYFGTAEGSAFVEFTSAINCKRTFVNYGQPRDWTDSEQGQGEEFLYHSIQCKNIWLPMGDIFAN
ncbi:aldehyde dehydrogenase family 16 member A1-like [Octopus vulgaris]|uniref:Aldehyde dehydrogenase family 16 member A1-like n=1 Tax=Octopus vulgaris TaxID=6645 RepID=A0AA36FH24_OCTVU|nr:aldehyde dehydrogenase family 16 member A1-like [Octopus vulgaris]